ncbi:MAG: vitamin K epoxide reductase family protein [Vicinamibacterales bacterium]
MKTYAKSLMLALALLALGASLSALYVHYQMLRDPGYSSFCEVSETVSCEEVLASSYSRLFGVPVAAGGAMWAALVFLLALRKTGPANSQAHSPVAGYIFVLSTLGLAVVLYLGYASFFVVGKACPLCLTMYVAVIGMFVVSGAATSVSLSSLPSMAMRDLQSLGRSPLAAAVAVLWVVASASLVALFPRENTAESVASVAAGSPMAPTETLAPEQRAEFEKWIAAQPRVSVPLSPNGAKVLVVKFNDFQCPACREAYLEYRGIVANYEQNHAGRVRFVTMDFPLEAECNLGAVHPSACEASAAVRMARAKGRGPEMEEWFFTHQETMTPATVKAAVRDVAQVTDFDAQYPSVLEQVKADAKLGRDLGVTGTPTFFVNGIKVPSMRPVYFDALIAYELARADAATPQ